MLELWDGIRKIDKQFTHSHGPAHNQITSCLVHSWNTFSARMSHEQVQIHNTHHGSNLGEATTFPLIIYFVVGHMTNTKCHFVPGLPSGSLEIPTIGSPTNLEAHNFACRPSIGMRSKTKL